MSKCERVKWSEVIEIKNGRNQKAVEDINGQYPIYGSGGIMGYANDYLCHENTVIIGRKGNINKPIYVNEKFWNVDTAFGLSTKRSRLLPKYLYYFCITFNFEKLNTTVTIPSLTKSNLLNIEIPLPPLETQKQIAKTLDTAAELLAMRKQQLAELDNLIKSTFYDMFGDPVANEKGWVVKNLRDLSSLITKGSSPTWQGINYTDDTSQVLFVTSENVREGYLDFSKRKYLENKFNEIQSRSILEYGDLLINIVGASIGRAAIFYSNEVANINQAVALIRCNKDVCLTYICHYFNSPKALQMYGEMQVDVARANLSLKNIGDLTVIYPPLSLQTQFAQIVTKIEEQKAFVKKAIDETQYLFDSLMSEYFE